MLLKCPLVKCPERKVSHAAKPMENEVFLEDEGVLSSGSAGMSSELEQNYRCMLDVKVSFILITLQSSHHTASLYYLRRRKYRC